jgi:hypothetical protein
LETELPIWCSPSIAVGEMRRPSSNALMASALVVDGVKYFGYC